jgi:type IV pilus assembly protein PilX
MSVFIHKRQKGFVLVVSLIFLVAMTLLGTTAIKKSILDEKLTGNLRSQNLAFQAAERALRFCESSLELRSGSTRMCQQRSALNYTETSTVPVSWKTEGVWKNKSIVTTLEKDGPNAMIGVAEQPQCMLERWNMGLDRSGAKQLPAWVITARGVGSVNTAVVIVQETIRCGSI